MCIVSTVRSERAVSNDLSVLCVNKVKLRKKKNHLFLGSYLQVTGCALGQ